MVGQDEHTVPVFNNVLFDTWREILVYCVEVEKIYVALSPPHESNFVGVNLVHDQCHGPYGLHRTSDDVFLGEVELDPHDGDSVTEGFYDISASKNGPTFTV